MSSLELNCDDPLSNFASNFNLRRYIKGMKSPNAPDAIMLRRCLHDIIFAHIYPRLDVEVSKHMNHLLKVGEHPVTSRSAG